MKKYEYAIFTQENDRNRIKNIKNYTRESTRSLRTKDKYAANMISKPKKPFSLSHRERSEVNGKSEEEKEKMVYFVYDYLKKYF